MASDEKIEKMERQLVRLRWFNRCLITCVVLSLGILFVCKSFGPEKVLAQSGIKEIRANSFVLEDENGKTRAALRIIGKPRGPALFLYDENGNPNAALLRSEDGTGLMIYDENGTFRVGLLVNKDGPALTLLDKKENFRVRLAVKDITFLSLYDENGKTRAALAVDKDGPNLLLDKNGEEIWKAP